MSDISYELHQEASRKRMELLGVSSSKTDVEFLGYLLEEVKNGSNVNVLGITIHIESKRKNYPNVVFEEITMSKTNDQYEYMGCERGEYDKELSFNAI